MPQLATLAGNIIGCNIMSLQRDFIGNFIDRTCWGGNALERNDSGESRLNVTQLKTLAGSLEGESSPQLLNLKGTSKCTCDMNII